MVWIYIDVLFFISFCMDTFLLWAAGRIVGFRAKFLRLLLGGGLAALCHCLWVLHLGDNGGIWISFCLLGVGTAAAYLPKTAKQFLRLSGGVWLASFLLSGGIQVLFTMTQGRQGTMLRYPWYLLLWAVVFSYCCLKAGARWVEANIQRRQEFCSVCLFHQGRQAAGRVLIDTGNGLKQADGRGVVILELSAILPLFSKEEAVRLLLGEREGLESLSFGSLGNPDGRLWGIRAEEMHLCYGEKRIIHKNIFVGMTTEAFTGAYDVVTPPCLLKEEAV